MIEITEGMLAELREQVMTKMSPKRFRHTAAVEDMTARLCALYCPEHTLKMRAAALLHDITKEKTPAEQEALCHTLGLPVTSFDCRAPKTFHARTGAAMIAVEYPAFNDEMIVNAVRWHTTGHKDMTLTEQLLFLADYIDLSRTYPACVMLRRYFWGAIEAEGICSPMALQKLLNETMLLALDTTIRDLMEEGSPIALDTVEARDYILQRQTN